MERLRQKTQSLDEQFKRERELRARERQARRVEERRVLLAEIARLDQAKQPRAALDRVFDALGVLILAREFEQVDAIPREVNFGSLGHAVRLGFLSSTFCAKDALAAWSEARERLRRSYEQDGLAADEVQQILGGLR